MRFARHFAARCEVLAVLAAVGAQAGSADAADDDFLFLPVAIAAHLSEPARQPPTQPVVRAIAARPDRLPSRAQILPTRVDIPDLYRQEFDVTLRRWVAPVNADRVVAVDLLPKRYRPWLATLAYDEEDRGPLVDQGDAVRLSVERRF